MITSRFYPWALLSLLVVGCIQTSDQDVVVYTALDKEFSDPILKSFDKDTEFHVRSLSDSEATKTVGLFNRLLQERAQPQCDVFWNNEILHTIRLARAGVLEPYAPPNAADWPRNFVGKDFLWIGFAARARVLLVNTKLVPPDQRPQSVLDLVDPQWKEQAGIARPLFGTTATHAAVMFAEWGDERAETFWRAIHEHAVVLTGNKDVALAVGDGQLAFGLTDTDDAIIEVERGRPVTIIFPDQRAGESGTLFIPNTLAVIRGCPHPAAARMFVDYLLRPQTEQRLAAGPSAQFPIRPALAGKSRITTPANVRWMDADFEAAADHWEKASQFLDGLFGSGVSR